MKKALKLLVLLSLVYEDLKYFITKLYRGTPKFEGAILLAANTNIKPKLVEQLNKQSHPFIIYGDEKHPISCNSIDLETNNVYILSPHDKNVCNNGKDNLLKTIFNSVKIPFYIKWFGYNSIHVELFWNSIVAEKDLSLYPIASTIIMTSSPGHALLYSAVEELIFNSFESYNSSPYIRFINYILNNPDDTTFLIKTETGVKAFVSNIESLLGFDDKDIQYWQKEQIKSFVNFFESLTDLSDDKNVKEFQEFIDDFKSYSEWIANFEHASLVRYKELLLFHSINKGQIEKVRNLLLNSEVKAESTLLNGVTPFYLSAHLGDLDMSKLLMDLKSPIDSPRNNGATPLMVASLGNHNEIVELLLNNGANTDSADHNGNTALILSVLKGNKKTAELLLKFGANVNCKTASEATPLILASSKGDTEMIKLLLDGGANTEHTNSNFYTPLMLASLNNHADAVELLIKYGAKIDAQNTIGDTAIFIAASNGNTEIVKILLNLGIDINILNGNKPLILSAVIGGDLELVKYLLACGPDLKLSDNTDIKTFGYNYFIKEEIAVFEQNPIIYILKNNHEVDQCMVALANINLYDQYQGIYNIIELQNCLSELDYDKSYIDLARICYHGEDGFAFL